MEVRSKLFTRARLANLERPKIHYHILKKTRKNSRIKNELNSNINFEEINIKNKIDLLNKSNENINPINNNITNNKSTNNLVLPKINNNRAIISAHNNINNKNIINSFEKNISKPLLNNNLMDIQFNHINKKEHSSNSSFIKDNLFYTIIYYLDSKTFLNFMLTNKRFFRIGVSCDELWYNFYIKRFCNPPNHLVDYEKYKSNWRNVFIETCININKRNYLNLKKKFLEKYNKKNYSIKKDYYFLNNNLYKNLKPNYQFLIDDKVYQIKYILSNKNLSNVNFYITFKENSEDMNSIQKIKILFNEKNLGIHNNLIIEYNLKQMNFKLIENEEIINKNYKIYYSDNIIISTIESNYILFINISIPICKICEKVFDYLNNIHSLNKKYKCDCDSNFGLYDYSLLINLKSYNKLYYCLPIPTCDFKEDENNDELYYINDSVISTNEKFQFDIKSFINETLENFLIFDISLLSYQGDHILCESKPLIIEEDKSTYNYDDYNSIHYIAIINEKKYSVIFKFNINNGEDYNALVYLELRISKKYIESMFNKY